MCIRLRNILDASTSHSFLGLGFAFGQPCFMCVDVYVCVHVECLCARVAACSLFLFRFPSRFFNSINDDNDGDDAIFWMAPLRPMLHH